MDILSSLANIGFDWKVALANLVNFLIIFYLLKRFVFNKINTTLEDRKRKIDAGLTHAREAETARVMAVEEKKRVIKEAQAEAQEIVQSARDEERRIVGEAGAKGEKEAQSIIEQGKARIASEEKTMRDEVSDYAAALVVSSVEKILKEDITKERSAKIIKEELEKLQVTKL